MNSWLLVALGSAFGGVARYFVSQTLNPASGFPWGTFGVNVLGSLAIGALSGWVANLASSGGVVTAGAVRAFAIVGLCGGFTTFSTFSNETFRMIEGGHFGFACVYVFGSVAAGLVAVFIGHLIAR